MENDQGPFGLFRRYEMEIARLRLALSSIADAKMLVPDSEINIITLGCIETAKKALNGDEVLIWAKAP